MLVKDAVHMSVCWFYYLISTLLVEFQLTELSSCHGDHHLAFTIIPIMFFYCVYIRFNSLKIEIWVPFDSMLIYKLPIMYKTAF